VEIPDGAPTCNRHHHTFQGFRGRAQARYQDFSPVLSVSGSLESQLSNAPCCAIPAQLADRREVIMSMSEYEERFPLVRDKDRTMVSDEFRLFP
jgi:hypothetical protein